MNIMLLCSITQIITDALLKVFHFPELVTVIISILPIVEARGAIPVAFGYGISPPFALLYAFIGSSVMAPVLIAVLLPFVKWLSRTRVFRKAGQTIYEKFEKKSQSIASTNEKPIADAASDGTVNNDTFKTESRKLSLDMRKMFGVFAFVAIPLPLTGVWTGSAVAAITGLPYPKALVSVVAGNLVATSLITLLCWFFSDYIDYIILAIGIIAIVVVVVLIIKIVLHKSPKTEQDENKETE